MRAWLLWLLVLNLALQLPWAFHHGFYLPRMFVPVGELLALLAVAACWPRAGGRLLGIAWMALLVVELDRLVGVYLMDQDPLFYDQLFLLRHLAVLITDLWTPTWTAGAVGIVVATVAVVLVLRRAVATLREVPSPRAVVIAAVVALLCAAIPRSYRPVRWIVPELLANVQQSVRVWWGVRQSPAVSPYRAFSSVELTRRPDVQLYIVESYGRIIAQRPQTAADWLAGMDDFDAALRAEGWHTASGWCEAPVSGGRSWLADGSLVTGMPIKHESVYRHLLERMAPLPDLVEFFADQDYRTIRVAPKDRARPGIEMTNDLHFGAQVAFAELDYRGPALGWGWIPDQYSLGYVAENVLDGPPLFLLFHMVSSHLPWEPPPPILSDWRALPLIEGTPEQPSMNLAKQTFWALRRYKRMREVRLLRAEQSGLTLGAYADAIDYDLALLRQHILDQGDRDALIVIMGDHQPPLVGRQASMDVPMHLIARDPALLQEFRDHGFTPGMAIPPEVTTAIRHEGFFSLMVRALARCCGDGQPLPDYHPEGTPAHP